MTTYTYDNLSELRIASQPGKGQTVTYIYDGRGEVAQITDVNNGSAGYPAMTRLTTYTYDLAGNRLSEKTVQGGETFADNTFTYDALHRVVSISAANTGQGVQSIAYEYDGFGNRSRYTSRASGKGSDRNQDGYFFYDALNRVTLSGALDANGTPGNATERRTYDAAGNLKTAGTGLALLAKFTCLTAGALVDEVTFRMTNYGTEFTINFRSLLSSPLVGLIACLWQPLRRGQRECRRQTLPSLDVRRLLAIRAVDLCRHALF